MKALNICSLAITLLLAAAPAAYAQAAQTPYPVAEGAPADKLIVISDIHLGVNDAYAETVANKPLLVDFIHRVAATADIAEVVIAGDFFDEWFQPFSAAPHADSGAFYRQVAANNRAVVDAVNELMNVYGKKVTYLPGNHDITLDFDTVKAIFPGISQARDADGLGSYRAGQRGEIAIEHGHRYNVFVAPDNVTNAELSDGKSILPPGYFYTRIAASYVAEGRPKDTKVYPAVADPGTADMSRYGAYLYYRIWLASLTTYPVNESLDDKVMDASFAGFAEPFAISDVLPATDAQGNIAAKLFSGIQDNWEEIQTRNHVVTHLSFADVVMESAKADYTDKQAETQYFDVDPTVEVVVFGHTHAPLIQRYDAGKVYVNAGTWIDHNPGKPTGTFVLIAMGDTADTVGLYQYHADGSMTPLESK
jgi:UDP-2,3-diacylglucosamine pyrophosphatase LpxH